MRIRELSVSGTYYEAGKALGCATRKEVSHILEAFHKSTLYRKLQEYLCSTEGSDVLAGFEKSVEDNCANIVTELRGVADGAGVDYKELFLLNLEPEWLALFADVPESRHGIKYASTLDGCTNIHLPIAGSQQKFLGHTEDVSPEIRDCGFIIHYEIYTGHDQVNSEDTTESFTEYILPGILAGSKFGANKHGFMFAHNNIYQQGLNKSGIPRRFVFRSLVSVKNMEDAINKLKAFPGIATGYAFNCLYKENVNGLDEVFNGVFEVAGDEISGSQIAEYHPQGTYFHCNTFQHLKYPCHPEESSLCRTSVLKQLLSCDKLSNHSDLLKALSNHEDNEYPIFRTGDTPDYLCTAASGVFDSASMTLTVYGDCPDTGTGQRIDVLRYTSK